MQFKHHPAKTEKKKKDPLPVQGAHYSCLDLHSIVDAIIVLVIEAAAVRLTLFIAHLF